MHFKQLELKKDGNWLKRTMKAILIGAAIGFTFFYLTEGRLMDSIPTREILKSLAIGGFFGFFLTNSPCARGRC